MPWPWYTTEIMQKKNDDIFSDDLAQVKEPRHSEKNAKKKVYLYRTTATYTYCRPSDYSLG